MDEIFTAEEMAVSYVIDEKSSSTKKPLDLEKLNFLKSKTNLLLILKNLNFFSFQRSTIYKTKSCTRRTADPLEKNGEKLSTKSARIQLGLEN